MAKLTGWMSIISLLGHGSDGIQYAGHSLCSRICCISSHRVRAHSSSHRRDRPTGPTGPPASGSIQAWIRCIVCSGRGSRSLKNYTWCNSTTDATSFLDEPVNDPWTSTSTVPSCFFLPGFCDLRIA